MRVIIKIFKINLILTSVFLLAQVPLQYSADKLSSQELRGKMVQKFDGNVVFRRENMRINTHSAMYMPKLDRYFLFPKVEMFDGTDTLTCDDLTLHNEENVKIHAKGDVLFLQSDARILAENILYWPDADSGRAVGNVQYHEGDKSLRCKDFRFRKQDGFRELDFVASGNVEYRDSLADANAESIAYTDSTEFLQLLGNPKLLHDGDLIQSDSIFVQYSDGNYESIRLHGTVHFRHELQAFAAPQDSSMRQLSDEIFSESAIIQFSENRADSMRFKTMVRNVYNVLDDSLLMGENTASGDSMFFRFEEGQLQEIRVFGDARGEFRGEKHNSKLDSLLSYRAENFLYRVNENYTRLDSTAQIEYKDTKLEAGSVAIDWTNNMLLSEGLGDAQPIITTRGNAPMRGEKMEFNLLSKTGRIVEGRTAINRASYQGDVIYREDPNIYYVHDSKYSSCDHEHPHYYFASKRMKMMQNDIIVARPLILYIFDIPVIGLPLAVLPDKGGRRHSGWIMPSFGSNSSEGTFAKGLGYFWAPNDYFDVLTKINFRDKLGMDIFSQLLYKKRYRFDGKLQTTLYRRISGDDIADLFTKEYQEDWKIVWNHQQKIDDSQRFSANLTYLTNNDFNQAYSANQASRLEQRMESKVFYSKSWQEAGWSLSLTASESFNLLAEQKTPLEQNISSGAILTDKTRNLPKVSISKNNRKVFGDGDRWYHNIFYSYGASINRSEKLSLVAENDSTWASEREKEEDTFSTHRMTFRAPNKYFGWLNLEPNLSLSEGWLLETRAPEFDEDGLFTGEYREEKGFARRLTGNASLSANTILYGVFPIEIGNLSAVRHKMSPRISYSVSPDFSKEIFGVNPGYFIFDADGEEFDRFAGSKIGSTPSKQSRRMSFSVANVFQVKTHNTEGEYEKKDLFTFNLSSSYNFEADSMKLAPISGSLRGTMPGGLRMDVKFTEDPYKLREGPDGLYRSKDLGTWRMTSLSASTSLKLSDNAFGTQTDSIDVPNPKEKQLWSMGLSFRYSLKNRLLSGAKQRDETMWTNASASINIGQWRVSYSARIDLMEAEIISQSFDFKRPLHCWNFSFHWEPSGYGRGFHLKINVTAPDLRDIKLESHGGRRALFGF